MRRPFFAALALTAASSLRAQGAQPPTDLSYVAPVAGSWNYRATATGSEATFSTAAGPQLTIRCTRATRRVAIVKPTSAASATMWVWTSAQAKSVPASFDAASARVTADLAAFDPLLDLIALSRGRVGFSTSGLAALVVPSWGEIARVVEDCRL